eukprot:TRINITY_DN45059_c0_g1_i2.p1 TRINITY_DN45059_c0_g1~~TRINITY_DN45059_c0_g1_i2.p1  ORF type:complete len:904 (+),score=44.73 TRINITY_DN45059_c0_g1_i2:348-2714(+)
MSILLILDGSAMMEEWDVRGFEGSRMDVLLSVVPHFIKSQRSTGAANDRYSVAILGRNGLLQAFQDLTADKALAALREMHVEPKGKPTFYHVVEALRSACSIGRRTRALFLAGDGQHLKTAQSDFEAFQRLVDENEQLDVQTIGVGPGDFLFLQQVASVGRGSFSSADLDLGQLENTFTSVSNTITQTRELLQKRELRTIFFDATHGYQIGKRFDRQYYHLACRTTFCMAGQSLSVETNCNTAVTWRRRKPFMQGGMRIIYEFWDFNLKCYMVAKLSKYKDHDEDHEFVMNFAKNSAAARQYADRFHDAVWWAFCPDRKREPPRLVKVADCYVYTGLPKLFTAEEYLWGSEKGFLKWLNNRGESLIPRGHKNHAIAAEAFAHFSLDFSCGREMVTDIQGVLRFCKSGHLPSISTTDPQIVSVSRCYGDADLGESSMQRFRALHRCNMLCRRLHLSSFTVSPQPLPRARLPISARLNGPAVQKHRPSVKVPPPEWSSQPQRGRSPHARRKPSRDLPDSEKLTVEQFLFLELAQPKKLLFVGEYTHSFSAACARLVAGKMCTPGRTRQSLAWWSTALDIPTSDRSTAEYKESTSLLRLRGVRILSGIDASRLESMDSSAVGLHGAIWVMAYPREATGLARSSSDALKEHMQDQVTGFVRSSAPRLHRECGKVSVIFMARQHLAWKLPMEIATTHGDFIREVFFLDLRPFCEAGYQPRHGDRRDNSRDPTYHKTDQVVIAQWRIRRGADDKPGGMSDPRVRSISSSHSRSASRGRHRSTSRRARDTSHPRT